MYDHPQPRRAPAPSPISRLVEIARRGLPFTSVEGQAFFRIPLPSGGFAILPVREPACRDWFFANYYAEYDSLPSAHAFSRLPRASADLQSRQRGPLTSVAMPNAGLCRIASREQREPACLMLAMRHNPSPNWSC